MTSHVSSGSDERTSADLVLVIGGATHSSSEGHALHLLYTMLTECKRIDTDVIVVDPTPEAEWTIQCSHRAQYRLKHEPTDLDTFMQQRGSALGAYRRIAVDPAVIDDVFFTYCGYADRRLEFTSSAGYVTLTQTAESERNAGRFTWWEIDRRDPHEGPKFVQLLFGADATIAWLSAFLRRAPRHDKLLQSKTREVDARFVVEHLFS